ncbi:UNVERIFIED_CONTAM: Kinesin-like protein KIN-14L [Sesamum radiatum]|uniref:Kinesin-like protein KIN-14L n=1 Tax=Sesamum radiatum TaxID=300843 RepID=A0AAW2NBA9_SESRA
MVNAVFILNGDFGTFAGLMEDLTRGGRVGELNLASRRAEEAGAVYRKIHDHYFVALYYLVGPLGIPSQPSEREFISCLRNGLILCNVINKIQPGSVPKVIETTMPSQSLLWDSQPLPAYQYFENVRNFLVAAEELKLPIFEASVFERDNLEEGSASKVVDCLLALKAYHEWKQMTGGSGIFKPPRSPLVVHSAGRIHARSPGLVLCDSSRQLDMSGGSKKPFPSVSDTRKLEGDAVSDIAVVIISVDNQMDTIVKALAEHMVDTKENIDNNLVASYHRGKFSEILQQDSLQLLGGTISKNMSGVVVNPGCVQMRSSILDHLRERSCSPVPTSVPLVDLSNLENRKCCRACLKKGSCNHWNLVGQQERELSNIKLLLSSARKEVESLQYQLQNDLEQLGDQVLEMSAAALGYYKAVKENRNLYNMVQDLKGNIRVYCRIKPVLNPEEQKVIDFIGENGSLVVIDPKPLKDGKKFFQFNRVFGPTATQDEVYRDTQPLVRSVMDGYNVCIFAYGQTGSGKTYTMLGPPGGSAKDLGISYLALNDLFELSDQRKGITKVAFLTVRKLEIQSTASDSGMALPDATLHPVTSAVDVINLMKRGQENRAVGSTAINIRSSRSHSILSVHVHGEDASGSLFRSCLHLVDLAGSERVDKSEVTGDGLQEAQNINKSLACLVDVITALAQKNSHIPYRNSKLTLLLQNSLGGNAKTLMLAHVNPEGDSFGETMSTLKFAQRVSTVELGAARVNKESSEVLELKAQIESLKKALGDKEVQTPLTRKTKEAARTPSEKLKTMTERTPPRPRRLSIENSKTMALERSTNNDDKRGAKTPSVKPKQLEKTPPPRSRRLSIENVTTAPVERSINHIDKRGARTPPAAQTRSRRLSLEGPRNLLKDSDQIKLPEMMSKPIKPDERCLQNHSQLEEGKSITNTSCGQKEISGSLLMNRSNQRGPRSPLSSAPKSPLLKIDTATMKVPSFQIPKTPEPQIKSRNEIQRVLPSDHNISSRIQTPCSTQGKGSQIRKSLRTIGKLINGSEKRNQQKPTCATTPLHGAGTIPDAKSPTSSNGKALRRQSITSIQQPERSRRSSLGGVSTDSYGNDSRNAKTPPQVRASIKLTKRWL